MFTKEVMDGSWEPQRNALLVILYGKCTSRKWKCQYKTLEHKTLEHAQHENILHLAVTIDRSVSSTNTKTYYIHMLCITETTSLIAVDTKSKAYDDFNSTAQITFSTQDAELCMEEMVKFIAEDACND